jgi:cytochrome bd-type quinol oxidase subunit 1
MNYPIWDIPAPGLLIAFVAIVHVFISHFAVGGGLFLVAAERKARRERDAGLLAYVEKHSGFFVLLTLVGGAITGVGIWFTIGLIHPAATASLISAFVWGWAIEWTFFVVEIVAAMVYYYGWSRLAPDVHLTVGWIYFAAAWLSLAVINAILAFMLTPGAWIATHGFWDGILNPTYIPSTVARTAGAIGLAGLYAVLTATWLADAPLKRRIARYATTRFVLPAAVVLPLSVAWYLGAASANGVPVVEIFGARSRSIVAVFQAALSGSPSRCRR